MSRHIYSDNICYSNEWQNTFQTNFEKNFNALKEKRAAARKQKELEKFIDLEANINSENSENETPSPSNGGFYLNLDKVSAI
jgi:hypothetical protein